MTIKFFSSCLSLNNIYESENIFLENIKDINLSFNNIKYQTNNDLIKLNKFIDKHSFLKKIQLQNNEILNIFKKTENQDKYKNELKEMIQICATRNIKLVLQTEFFTLIDNEIFKNIFIYKNKYY